MAATSSRPAEPPESTEPSIAYSGPTKKTLYLHDAFIIQPGGDYHYSWLQIFGIFLSSIFPLCSLIVIGLRIYSRKLAKGFGMDDYLIFLAMFLTMFQSIFTVFVLRSGYWGIHNVDIPKTAPPNGGAFWNFINGVVYTPILALVKVSALLFLLRLGGTKKRVRLACHIMITFNLLQLFTFLPLAIVQCLPVHAPWVTTPGSGAASCLRRDIYAMAQAIANILTDILTLLIPFFVFLDLRVNRRVRIALMSIFMLGAIVTIVSFVRMYYVLRLYYLPTEDRHWSIGYVCSCVEINLAIITASVPALWPLARRWYPGAFESLGIDRPYLYPDIEVAYATQQSRASRILRGTVVWKKYRNPPSGVAAAAASGSSGPGGRGGLADIREQPMQSLGASTATTTTTFSLEKQGQGSGLREEDGTAELTYHDLVRKTGENNDHRNSLPLQGRTQSLGAQEGEDRGLRTFVRGM